jgi:hypothetical protein
MRVGRAVPATLLSLVLLVAALFPLGVPGSAWAVEEAGEEAIEETVEEEGGSFATMDASTDPDSVVVLHGGEVLTTSSTGQGSDPMHTEIIFQLAPDATGEITFMPDPHNNAITIIGNGFDHEPNNVTFNIAKGINVTIRDFYLRTTDDSYLINFNGLIGNSNLLTNQMMLEGTNILEKGASNSIKSVIHVASGTDVTLTGNGYLYLDKDTAGAGIGGDGVSDSGQAPETPGSLTIAGGNLYLSGRGMGAVIGTGGGGSPAVPGDITVKGGNLNVATSSAAAGIGGGANSPGGNLSLTGGTVTVTTDARGSAIGKGGNATVGVSGGTLVISGGSLKTCVTQAATVYWNVPVGVTDAVITATMTDTGAPSAAPGLFAFDTSLLERSATYFIALANNAPFFSGVLHTDLYDSSAVGTLPNRWGPPQPVDTLLYLRLPKTSTRLSVNGEGFTLAWNEGTKAFYCEPGEPDDGSVWNGMVDTSWYTTTGTEFWLQGGAQLAGLAQIVNGTAVGIAQDSFAGKTVGLLNDVDLNGLVWTPIGRGTTTITFAYTNPDTGFSDASLTNVIDDVSLSFDGAFNGNGKTIDGLYIDSTEGLQGFFGFLGVPAQVSRLTIEGTLRTTSSKDAVGGLVGFNRGMIDHYTGNVEIIAPSTYNVGGIAGFNDGRTGNGAIQYSANRGNVHGYVKVGGITGQNAGLIKSCYNTGSVDGTNASSKNGVGGIAGRNGNNNVPVEVGLIVNCFSICEVGRDGGQKWVGGITGFQNTLSRIEGSYFAGSFPSWSGNKNNPIVGATDVPALATEMNVRNYTLDTIEHSGTAQGEIGIPVTSEYMKSPAFIDDINGQDGTGRAFLSDFAGSAALNDGYPILRGVHVEDTAVPTGVRIISDPVNRLATEGGHYAYTEGQRFDTKGFLAVADYSDGTSEKLYDIELSIPGVLSTADVAITLTVGLGGFSASKSYTLVVTRDDIVDLWVSNQPVVTIYASGERFSTNMLELMASYSSGARRVLGGEEYTFEPQTLHAGDTEVVVSHTFNGVEKKVSVPVTVLESTRPERDDNDAYQIKTQNDLIWFMAQIGQDGAVEYDAVLMENLDMRDTIFTPIVSIYLYLYQGSFDGNGKSVTFDVAAGTNYVGMFRVIGEQGVVKNLTVKGSVRGTAYVGGIAGLCLGTIEGCRNEATITATATAQANVGGIVGSLEGTLRGCVNTGSVEGQNFVGGIAGAVGSASSLYGIATIENATNSGAVSAATTLAGGIVGLLGGSAVIRNVENSGTVVGGYQVGGIVGEFRGTATLEGVRNTGTVGATTTSTTTSYSAGGIVGYLSSTGTVERGVNTGPVTGRLANTGGIVGYVSSGGTVLSCYNGATVTGTAPRDNITVGGIIGAVNNASATLSNCYDTGVALYAPEGGTADSYTVYRGPILGQYKPAGAINTARITGDYYSANAAEGMTGISVGTVVTAVNRTAVKTLLKGITNERAIMLDAGYPIPISLYIGPVATGDVDGDTMVTASDLLMLSKATLSLISLSNAQIVAVDMDADDLLTASDLIAVARKALYG